MDRHYRNDRACFAAARKGRISAANDHSFGSGHVPVAGKRADRYFPRQLDAASGRSAQTLSGQKSVEQAGVNLEGARIGLAATGKDLGIKTYADIAKFKDELGGKIYGIEAGSSANATIQSMIEKDNFGLKDFQLAESSEQAMLSQVQNAVRKEEPVVFFAWTPHPMNIRYKLTYLQNGDNLFGPDDGAATVETLTRKGYAADCPNVARFLSNLKFNTEMESTMMNMILNDGMEAKDAVAKWIKENPTQLDAWLDGVTTFDGKPALAEVKSGLGL